ncbi:Cyclic AMP-dependent transcription factor ATF-7 [Podila verticillata]|nr:Cyclic AMP-dependent transcription factor ATF-7 [Podila verticillata]
MSATAMSFLHTDVRRDANPTPTRFLLECGAFTPGFGLNLDTSFNPFDASYKFLNTGTPKAELNPFDTSFRTPTVVSVVSSTNNTDCKDTSLGVLDMDHPWFDAEKMTSNSPGFSPSHSSSSSFSASPSPQLPSLPIHTASLQGSFSPSSAPFEAPNTYYVYENSFQNNAFKPAMTCQKNSTFSEHEASDDETINENTSKYNIDHRTNMEEDAMGSPEPIEQDQEDIAEPSQVPSPKKATATKSLKDTKSHDAPRGRGKGTKSRKRKTEQLSPEAKRQRFLERNRMAASKCREKKRLQTLQIISDADTITARNQELHETLAELEDEVRRLKNQILGHRDCGCDVIQKFVQSFGPEGSSSRSLSSSTSAASSSSLSMSMMEPPSPTAFTFSMPSSIF